MTAASQSSDAAQLDVETCPPKTRTDLEWDRVLGAIGDRCVSTRGQAVAMKMTPLSYAEIGVAYNETREVIALADADEPLPRRAVADVASGIDRARIGATLSNDELRGVLAVLNSASELRRFLRQRRERCPALFSACSTDPGLDELALHLESCFDPDGSLSDRASPRLGELRAEMKASRARLIRRMDELIRRYRTILQDDYWTERDGRYVLPVRSDAHERFPGIVHATSDSGSTLFVEPRALVPMGNRHKMLKAEVSREEAAVYVALSARVAEVVEEVAAAASAVAYGDYRAAVGRLAADLNLRFPVVVDATEPTVLELQAARHPLLALDGVDVVPSDLAVSGGQAMIVSGPNAGGKTVALKTMGLCVLMVRAGLPIPANETSRVSCFQRVLTDVGDEQNLSKNLSTFSAHVQNLAGILDATHDRVLVLLDELAGGTDPREGEALASAILDSLCARGGAVACTTHYEGLKVLAFSDDRFRNASVGFDMKAMRPTFKLTLGVPGASSALAVARRFGISTAVVERAEKMLSQETVTLSEMVEQLARQRRGLELAKEDAEREAAILKTQREAADAELERLRNREKTNLSREGQALLEQLRRAREELRAAQAKIRSKRLDDAELKGAAKAIDRVAAKVSIGGPLDPNAAASVDTEQPSLRAEDLRIGMRVHVPRIRADAEVLEILPTGQLRVAAGPLKLLTTVAEVRPSAVAQRPSSKSSKKSRSRPAIAFDAAADPDTPIQTSDNTVDLRGLRVHEAVGMAEQFLDRCLGAGLRVAFLIHGHGTGALRDALRDALSNSPYVDRMKGAEPRDGGDGVTVVWLS